MTNSLQKVKTVVRGKLKKPNKRLAILLLFVILALGVLYLSTQDNTPKEIIAKSDCSTLTKKAGDLLAEKKHDEAYKLLKPQTATCGTVLKEQDLKDASKINDNVELLMYNRGLAVAAYRSGDKDQSKIYADQALKLREQITPEVTALISEEKKAELNLALYDLYTIQDGTYEENVVYPNSAGSGQ